MTMLTQVFGVRGRLGNMVIVPKLLAEQFDADGCCAACMTFAGRKCRVVYHNPNKLEFGRYAIEKVLINDQRVNIDVTTELEIARSDFLAATIEESVNVLDVFLNGCSI